jgi:hypothetical protein
VDKPAGTADTAVHSAVLRRARRGFFNLLAGIEKCENKKKSLRHDGYRDNSFTVAFLKPQHTQLYTAQCFAVSTVVFLPY